MLHTERISSSQLTALLMGFMIGSSVLFPPGQGAGNMGWLALLGGIPEGILIALIYVWLTRRFPRKTMIEIADVVYGPRLGKLVSAAFIGYLFYLATLVSTNFFDFIKLAILVETPSSVIVLFGALVVSYCVANGIEVLGRVSQGMVILAVSSMGLITALLINQIKPGNYLPILLQHIGKLAWTAHGVATFPFGETVAFAMILPFLNRPKEGLRSVLSAIIATGCIMAVVLLRNIGVLGNMMGLFTYPGYYVAQLISVGEVFTRLEILIAINFVMMGFLKIAVLHYGVSLGIAQLLRLPSLKPLVLPLGILISSVALINFSDVTENIKFAGDAYPLFALPFQVGIPLLTLVIAVLRKLPTRGA